MILSRLRKARAARSAKNVASVPVEVKRICSPQGTARQISSARRTTGSAPPPAPAARAPPAPDDERQLVGEPRRAEHAARQALRGQLEQPALLGGPRAGRLAHAPPRSWCVIGRAQRAVRSGQSAS